MDTKLAQFIDGILHTVDYRNIGLNNPRLIKLQNPLSGSESSIVVATEEPGLPLLPVNGLWINVNPASTDYKKVLRITSETPNGRFDNTWEYLETYNQLFELQQRTRYGFVGAEGPAGETGPRGATGPQGIQGIQGTAGVKGDTGATGPQGPQGIPGAKGTTGDTGNTGATGAAGLDSTVIGPTGPTGAVGDTGPKGDTGATGAASTIPGPTGPSGADGSAQSVILLPVIDHQHGAFLTNAQALALTSGASSGLSVTSTSAESVTYGTHTHLVSVTYADGHFNYVATGSHIHETLKLSEGDIGPAGPTGATGNNGAPGATGPTGATGNTGATGAAGIGFRAALEVAYAPTVILDCATHDSFNIAALTGDIVIGFTGAVDGQKIMVNVVQDVTGNRAVTTDASVAFSEDIPAIDASTTANKSDVFGFVYHAPSGKYRLVSYIKGF